MAAASLNVYIATKRVTAINDGVIKNKFLCTRKLSWRLYCVLAERTVPVFFEPRFDTLGVEKVI